MSWIDEIGSGRFDELARNAVREAIAGHHAAGQATCHGDGEGLYLLFPDQSKRYFPAGLFPDDETDRLPYWLKWCEFIQALYQIITPAEWLSVHVQYGRRESYGPFYAEIAQEGISAEHWLAVHELASRIESEHRTEQEYLA